MGSSGAGVDGSQARQAADMLRKNPEMAKQAAEMMANLSQEQIDALVSSGAMR